MKLNTHFFVIALSCLSCACINGERIYVKAKKAGIVDSRRIEVAILAPDNKTVISDDTFRKSSNTAKGKSKLFFNFDEYPTNKVVVFQNGYRKAESGDLSADNVSSRTEIIIDRDNVIEIKNKK